ncbi:MAG: hypothetical protein GTN62_12255 [Gemmatimonadales bacterium]|nr:hypothetical protein [Gemmatimonadales bacterium]NIN12497.1 hypothetical protein [Gemmatimonadales bacterium]NIN50868.1 hypothetical protein [Gemmatimonadales bacterium]NIP08332.1 hypothetical protein [Gemmatimonadales bacterium]NIR03429.1 hypothetical protein [Gemmatimonadales bacterium]
MRSVHSVPLAALIVGACAGAPQPSLSPTPDTVALDLALSYTEEFEGSGKTSIAPSQHLAIVDYKSRLVINPSREFLQALATTERDILPALADFEQMRINSTAGLVKAATEYVENATAAIRAVEAAGPADQLAPSQVEELQERIGKQAELGLALITPVRIAAEAEARMLHGDDEDAVVAAVDRMTVPIFQNASGQDVILNVPVFAEFLARQIKFASRRARVDAEIANVAGTARFRMRAWLRRPGKEPVAVSIQNYDDIHSFDAPKRPRIAFRMTEREQRRLEQGSAVARDAAQLVRDLRNRRSALRLGLPELQSSVEGTLEGLTDLVLDSVPTRLTTTLLDATQTAKSALDSLTARYSDLQQLEAFIGGLNQGLASIKAGIDGLRSAAADPSPAALLQFSVAVPHTVSGALTLIVDYSSQIPVNLQRLDTLAVVLADMVTEEAAAVRSAVERELSETKGALRSLADQMSRYATLVQALQELFSRNQAIAVADELDASNVDPRVRTLDLDAVVPGTVFLNATPADRGDALEVRAELVALDDTGQEETLQEARRMFRVERLGLTSDFSAHLIFVNRFGTGDSDQSDASFEPAPSASWTLHHRIRSTNLWSFFDPGIGVNTAALDFDDDNFQIGVGMHVTLFNDLLTYGVGYNLNADSDNWYHYFGVEVLQALETVGSAFGGLLKGGGGG